MEEIQKVQSSLDPCIIPNIQYARGFIERDLKPDSLWSKSANAKNARLIDEAAGGSSERDVHILCHSMERCPLGSLDAPRSSIGCDL